MYKIIQEYFTAAWSSIMQFSIRDAIDIFLVAIIVYNILLLTKKTRAFQVLRGLGVVLFSYGLTSLFGLATISWLFDKVLVAGAIAIIVIFQPELRRALERIGRGSGRKGALTELSNIETEKTISDICQAMISLSKRKVGALIVFERVTGLGDIISTGVKINGEISTALLEQIFEPNTPLHDGAMIISGTSIVSAGCFLPLSDNGTISKTLGTRHRAALGVSEVSDCMAFVVSEETGIISVAIDGKLERDLEQLNIEQKLLEVYQLDVNEKGFWRQLWERRKRA